MKSTAILFIHGFTGTTYETEPVVNYLQERYILYAPVLKGHNTGKKDDLKGISYREWIATAENVYMEIKEKHDSIIVVGFSIGGLIALDICSRHNPVAVITVNAPIWYIDLKKILKTTWNDMRSRKFSNIKRYARSGGRAPFSALIEFMKLVKAIKPQIDTVKTPAMVMQADDDDVAMSKSAGYIHQHLASTSKILKTYVCGGHLIWHHDICAEVLADIDAFIRIKTNNNASR